MVSFGMGMAPVEPISKVIWVAKLAEDLGFEYFMNADQIFNGERDAFVSLSAAAMSTSRIKLGTCVSNPFSRIPGMLALAIASLDELSGGRAVLGLGAGGAGFAQLHLDKAHSNQAIGETVAMIRGLLRGEAVTFEGKLFKLSEAELKFAARPDIPIIFASRSPRNLELAGEIADGVLLATYTTYDHLKFAIDRVRAGAQKAGRRFEDVKLISWVYTSISDDDGRQAVENVRWFVTQALINTSADAYPVIFKGFPAELPEFLNKCRELGRQGIEVAYKDRTHLTDEVIKRFSVAGTAEDCIAKIREITSFGIDTVWLRCFSAPRSQIEHEKVIVPFAEKVMPAFSGTKAGARSAAVAR
jgi:5,10-methylenetetrahydromethanopterin reductase